MTVYTQISNLQIGIGNPKRYYYSKDGTNYDILAFPLPKGIQCGYMCLTTPSVLIISGYDKTAYAFALNTYTSWDYIQEKLCPKGSKKDAENLKILIDQAKEDLK